jgi:hypothetical protein
MLKAVSNNFYVMLDVIAAIANILVKVGYFVLALLAASFVITAILVIFGVANGSILPEILKVGLLVGFTNLIPMAIADSLDN